MEQQRALNALEPFIALSKSATSPRAAADLVTQATSASNTYVFAELLQTPNIQALRNSPEHAPSLKLLEIFAWGTYADYQKTPNLPALSPAQAHKLRLLSLPTLLSNSAAPSPSASTRTHISYAHLQSALSLPDTRALETLLAAALSSGLISGHLDPLHALIGVTATAPLRDLPPGSAPALAGTLAAWESRCDAALADLDARAAAVRDNARLRSEKGARRRAAFDAELESGAGRDDGSAGAERRARGGNAKRSAPMMDVLDDEGAGDAMELDEGMGGSAGAVGGGAASKGGPLRGAKKLFSKGGR